MSLIANLALLLAIAGALTYILVPDTNRWPRVGRVGFFVFVLALAAWLLSGGASGPVHLP